VVSWDGDGGVEGWKGGFVVYLTSNGNGAIDVVPPATVDTGVGDEDDETDAEEQLGDADEVEGFAGHGGE